MIWFPNQLLIWCLRGVKIGSIAVMDWVYIWLNTYKMWNTISPYIAACIAVVCECTVAYLFTIIVICALAQRTYSTSSTRFKQAFTLHCMISLIRYVQFYNCI